MSFQSLKVDELKKVAASFAVEPEVADEEHGPTKKELIAALAESGVSWKDYQALQSEVEDDEVADEVADEAEEEAVEETVEEPAADEKVADEPVADEPDEDAVEDEDDAPDEILVKYVRKNPTWEQAGYRFTQDHPFKSLPSDVAERLIKSGGFTQALPSEVKEYYN